MFVERLVHFYLKKFFTLEFRIYIAEQVYKSIFGCEFYFRKKGENEFQNWIKEGLKICGKDFFDEHSTAPFR